jgi:hypothetical protein
MSFVISNDLLGAFTRRHHLNIYRACHFLLLTLTITANLNRHHWAQTLLLALGNNNLGWNHSLLPCSAAVMLAGMIFALDYYSSPIGNLSLHWVISLLNVYGLSVSHNLVSCRTQSLESTPPIPALCFTIALRCQLTTS